MFRKILVAALLLVVIVPVAQATERTGCRDMTRAECKQKRQKIASKGYPFCNTWKCVKRVRAKRERRLRRALRKEMRGYRSNPLPWCTWGPESGAHRGQWSMARYRQPNVSGGTGGGKFQILISTWYNFGGGAYAGNPIYAKPVYQERVARRIAADSLKHWVNC